MTDVIDRAGDIGEFEELKRRLDTRLITEMKAEDDWTEGTITRVDDGKGSWGITYTEELTSRGPIDKPMGGMGLGCPRKKKGPEPRVGGRIRVYGKGFGFQFHGIDLDGQEVFWRTPYERLAERVRWLAEHDRKQRERLADQGAEYAAKVAALPEALRKRIERFEKESPSFWLDSGGYELFCCTEAAKIAEALRGLTERTDTPDQRVKWFRDLPYAEQVRIAGIDDGHSGNTFGGACALAHRLLIGGDC